MRFIPNNENVRRKMLDHMGLATLDQLFESIPEAVRLSRPLALPSGMSEPDQLDLLEAMANRNAGAGAVSFVGGGSYSHFIPLVIDTLISRAEFFTAYTPYQPEIAQGTLQATFEFQTFITRLTGMDVANASLYDGASAAAESVLMALRLKKGRTRVLLAESLHPLYRAVVETYTRYLDVKLETVAADFKTGQMDLADLQARSGDDVACVVVQSPNFFGVVENLQAFSNGAHACGSLSVVVVAEALSLALLKPPGRCGADIVAGEAQSFGISQGFGGPYLGFMACRDGDKRQMPGRITGQTVDADGRRGFVLTLSTREQHIRREKATSNICTNQSLMMLRAVIYLALMGRDGLGQAARQNAALTHYFAAQAAAIPGYRLRFTGSRFNEVALTAPVGAEQIVALGAKKGVAPGLALGAGPLGGGFPREANTLLVAVTEARSKAEIDQLIELLKEAAR